jgi:epoxyqueuosine reductase
MSSIELSRAILERCRALGFALAGVARAAPSDRARELRQWLGAGRHGEMHYLASAEDVLVDPARLLPGARSIICVADRYHDGAADPPADPGAGPRGRIARYARGRDYHRAMRLRLHALADELRASHPGAAFRSCVDTAPLLEREHAQRAGLGAVGKHTLLIEFGGSSYLLLGEIVTTLDLAPTEEPPSGPGAPDPGAPDPGAPAPGSHDPCGTCTRCVDACPTGAIAPWSVDATRCISYLTIEHRGPIDRALHEPMGDWIFGCDVCQEVCPHNQPTERKRAAAVHGAYAPRRSAFALLEVLAWTEDDRRRAFAGSAMKRAKLVMMKRNALIAAGNALRRRPDPALRARIEEIAAAEGEDELVRATARDVLLERGIE